MFLAAAEAASETPWIFENIWIVPAIPALSFLLIIAIGKRLPMKGSEIGLASIAAVFALSMFATYTWVDQIGFTGGHSEESAEGDTGDAEYSETESLGGGVQSVVLDTPGFAAAEGDESSEEKTESKPVPNACFADEDTGDSDDAEYGDDVDSADKDAESQSSDETDSGTEASAGIQTVSLTNPSGSSVYAASDGYETRGEAIITDTCWFKTGADSSTASGISVGTLVDGQSIMMLFVVSIISGLVHIYSTDYVNGDRRYTHYFAFLSLFTAAMLFMVLSSSTLQLIVGWELVGVCSFGLIGHWWEEKPNSDAALKAFLTNRVGDIGLLIGMIVLYFGAERTFDIAEINRQAVAGEINQLHLSVAALCLMTAIMSKSGQFVLHTWLPDAMAGPTPVSALIHAATMVVAGVYMIGRLYPVFWEGFMMPGTNLNAMAFIGGLTTVGGGLLAFVQRDIKKVLAYSTVSQLGYMVLALGMGAYTAGMFHLFTHAFFKACLFLGAGSVSHACHHSFDMKSDMGGLRKYMPKTFWTFMIGTGALMGIPPLAGFWSKDEILVGAQVWPGTSSEKPGAFVDDGEGFWLAATGGGDGTFTIPFIFGCITAALTAAYMTRVIMLTFFGEYRGGGAHDDHGHDDAHDTHAAADHDDAHDTHDAHGHDDAHGHGGLPHESGSRITIPLMILAFMASVVGFLNMPSGFVKALGLPEGWAHRFEDWVEPVGTGQFPAIDHAKPSLSLAVFATGLGLISILVVRGYYMKLFAKDPMATEYTDGLASKFPPLRALHNVLENKYYLDHLYSGVIAGGTTGPLARAAYWVNQNILDGIINTVGKTGVLLGRFIYRFFDQGVVDGAVNSSGQAAGLSGQFLRGVQSGQVRNYATLMFGATALIVAVFMFAV